MASKVLHGGVLACLLFVAGWATSAKAQPYGNTGVYGSYPYGYYGDTYVLLPGYIFPYASQYLPSYSYTPSPYMPVPGGAAYGGVPFTYSPNAYTYDLYAQSLASYPPVYFYPPDYDYSQTYTYPPATYYLPPPYPYGYYRPFIPRRWRSPYRPMTLPEYFYRASQGPTRVRDIVPGIPELGG
jgi:hypothetical protein